MPQRNLGAFVQNAWIVPDLETAIRRWVDVAGVGPFFISEEIGAVPALYRGSPTQMECAIALAQAGPIQIELIQPKMPPPSVYHDVVREGETGFHHLMRMTDDFDRDIAKLCDQGLVAAGQGAIGDVQWAYIDTRHLLGCMLELVSPDEGLLRMFELIRKAAAEWHGQHPIRRVADLAS